MHSFGRFPFFLPARTGRRPLLALICFSLLLIGVWAITSERSARAALHPRAPQSDGSGFPAWTGSNQSAPEFVPGRLLVRVAQPAASTELRLATKFQGQQVDRIRQALAELKSGTVQVRPLYQDLARQLENGMTLESISQQESAAFPIQAARTSSLPPARQVETLAVLASTYLVTVNPEASITELCTRINTSGRGLTAEPDWKAYTFADLPNDPFLSTQGTWKQPYQDMWGLKAINTPEAWNTTTGKNTVIAIVDTGIDYTHPDLTANLWKNPKEIPNNGVDDDGNGFVDDTMGWDFAGRSFEDPNDSDADPRDGVGHGTHVAGIAGAVGNNKLGVIGVAYQAKLMAVKVFPDESSFTPTSDIIAGIEYAAKNGADVINLSLGSNRSQAMSDVINFADSRGCVVVASAGNSNTTTEGVTPAELSTVLTVGAIAPNLERSYFSNYGPKLDVVAPGSDVLSCLASNSIFAITPQAQSKIVTAADGTKYLRLDGTSMASPHVSGVVALVRSKFPFYSNEQIRQVLKVGTEQYSIDLTNRFTDQTGYGRINADLAVRQSERGQPLIVRITSPLPYLQLFNTQKLSISGTVMGSDLVSYSLFVGEGASPKSWTQISTGTASAANRELGAWTLPAGVEDGVYTIRLAATNRSGNIYLDQAPVLVITDKDLAAGWPISFGGATLGSPAVADLDGDGKMEVVVAGQSTFEDGRIFIFKADGTPYSSAWPKPVNVLVQSSPALGDLDGDGKLDIVVLGFQPGPMVYAYRATGERISGFPVKLNNFITVSPFPLTTPTIADIDRDGRPEVLVMGGGFTIQDPPQLVALTGNGQLKWAAPLPPIPLYKSNEVIGLGGCTPMVGDITGDSAPEILTAYTIQQTNTASYFTTYFAFDNRGNLLPGWPVTVGPNDSENGLSGTGALADLDGDGKSELIVSRDPKGDALNPQIFAFKGNGKPLAGWPQTTTSQAHVVAPPAVGDLDGDGKPEVVFRTSQQILAYHANGTLVNGFPAVAASIYSYSPPVIGDVDGDAKPEILFTGSSLTPFSDNFYFLYAFHADGKPLTDWPKRILAPVNAFFIWSSFSLCDLDGDGKVEAVFPALEKIYTYKFSGPYRKENIPWGTYQQNNQRTGALK
ncbi:MAG: S8 family serine peptidase [Blastocatellia bacterium]|nr:S8 family serine peptidase [Blastocatellia bacterium]